MIVLWGIAWGAVLGMLWPQSGDLATYIGGFFGFFAGLTLHFLMKRLVAKQIAQQRSALLAELREFARIQVDALGTAQQQARLAGHAATAKAPMASSHANPARPIASNQATQRMAPEATAAAPPTPTTEDAQAASHAAVQGSNAADQVVNAAKKWLLGGNAIVRVGLVVLFIGLSFLARYAAASGLLPVELRLAAIGSVGIALLAIGFRQRLLKPAFALGLQGAGIAVMYLTVFAAFKLYAMLPALAAFALMLVVCALSCALALLQNSRTLAGAAFGGGFAVPVLLSSGQGSHVGLFSYYMLLNAAIMSIAYKKSWRFLNVMGVLATFGVALAWGALKFEPQHYASSQPFLLCFLLIFIATAVLHARNTPTQLGNAVDSTLVFGSPLVAFGLQVGIAQQFELGAAFSALGFAALYLGLEIGRAHV